MMEVKIDVSKYIDEDEIKEMIKEDVEYEVGRMVREYFLRRSYESFVEGVAVKAYWEAVDKLGEDTMWKVRTQVRRLIQEMSPCDLVGCANRKSAPSRIRQIVCEEAGDYLAERQ